MFIFYFLGAIFLFFLYVKYKQTYWKRHGVYQFETEFLLGSRRKEVTDQESMAEASIRRYKILKSNKQPHGGMYLFLEPIYMPIDANIIKHIMLKDFSHFVDRGLYNNPHDVLSSNLFSLEGEDWKNLRVKLTPTFTSGKMKMMFNTILEKAEILDNVMGKYVIEQKPCDLKEILAQFTTDVIGSCAFGLECNSLENPEVAFRKYGKLLATPQPIRFLIMNMLPWKFLKAVNFYGQDPIINDFYTKIVEDTIKYRETNNISRKDFMQLLIEMKNGKSDVSLTVSQIVAQTFLFFAAGFETSSSATTFALYELSKYQNIQDKLREEILEVLQKHDGKITYDAIMEMKYLDKVFDETLRKYPTLPILPRICTKDYKIPGTDFTIEKGTRVEIPVMALQLDPEYFPNPEVFNPENFSDENKLKRPDFTYFPFGEGPRICIGSRFGKLQSKMALVTLLRKYKFQLNVNTQIPIKMKPSSEILVVDGNLWFDVSRI